MARLKGSTKAETERRIEVVGQLLLRGYSGRDIYAYVAEAYNASERTAKTYMQKARKMIADEVEDMRDHYLAEHLAARRLLRKKLIANGQLGAAHKVMVDEARLLNLYPAVKTELSGPMGGPIPTINRYSELSDQELKDRINDLVAKSEPIGPDRTGGNTRRIGPPDKAPPDSHDPGSQGSPSTPDA